MKITLLGTVFFLLCCTGCTLNKSKADSATIDHPIDSVALLLEKARSVEQIDSVAVNPSKKDESFGDFLYAFVKDSCLQKERVKFPLVVYKDGSEHVLQEDEWSYDSLFLNLEYYTFLFNEEAELDAAVDTSLSFVQVEWIFMKDHQLKRYYFERLQGGWRLATINNLKIEEDKGGEDFLSFLCKFATDDSFQIERIKKPLDFVTVDPDDDFSVMEATMDKEQWVAFRPVLPTEVFMNINYGKTTNLQSSPKILALKGVGNGISNVLYFKRKNNGNWMLYKFDDVGI